jgi:hypothetical protein
MRWVFAISLVLGMLALIAWVMLLGTRRSGSEARWRSWAPLVVAAAVAFGMGGLSASYAGWNLGWATMAAVVAAALAAWYAGTIDVPDGEDRD